MLLSIHDYYRNRITCDPFFYNCINEITKHLLNAISLTILFRLSKSFSIFSLTAEFKEQIQKHFFNKKQILNKKVMYLLFYIQLLSPFFKLIVFNPKLSTLIMCKLN